MDIDFEFPKIVHGTNTQLLKDITLNGLRELLGVEIDEE